MHLEADISKTTKDIGWKPETTFKQGAKETIEYWQSKKKGENV